MALYSYCCPNCGKLSLISPKGSCLNKLNQGKTCGYQLTFSYELGNHPYRSKVIKHTTPPSTLLPAGTLSWVDSKEKYSAYMELTMISGNVSLDPVKNYLFLWHTPSGTKPIAHIMYSDAGSVVSGAVLPLNSKIQNLHLHFSNWDENWISIAEGENLTIEEPCSEHPETYTVSRDRELIFWFNPNSKEFGKN